MAKLAIGSWAYIFGSYAARPVSLDETVRRVGELDFPRLVAAIRAAGYYDSWWCVDLCFWPQAWEVTAATKDYVAALLARAPWTSPAQGPTSSTLASLIRTIVCRCPPWRR